MVFVRAIRKDTFRQQMRVLCHVYCVTKDRVLYMYKHGDDYKHGIVSREFFDANYKRA